MSAFREWSKAFREEGLNITAADLSVQERALLRVSAEETRHQQNREAIAAGAVREFTHARLDQFSEVGSKLDDEWVDRFWRLAQDVSDAQVQSLWARILARQSAGTAKCSARCLEALSLLSPSEATLLERIATMTTLAEAGGVSKSIIVLSLSDYRTGGVSASDAQELQRANRRVVDYVGDLHSEIFGQIGIFIDDGWGHELAGIVGNQTVDVSIGQHPYGIEGYPVQLPQNPNLRIPDAVYIGNGTQLSPLGSEIIGLIQTEPDKEYVKLLGDALSHTGLRLAPGVPR